MNLLRTSLVIGALTLIAALLSPLWDKRFAALWKKRLWCILAAALVLGAFVRLPEGAAPVQIDLPRRELAVQPGGGDGPRIQILTPEKLPQMETVRPALSSAAPGEPVPGRIVPTLDLLTAAEIVWAAGTAGTALWFLGGEMRFRRKLRRWAEPVKSEALQGAYSELCAAMGVKTPPALLVCPGIGSPMLAGLLRPKLLLPTEDYAPAEAVCVLRHELIHRQSGDLWWKLLLLAAGALPLVSCGQREPAPQPAADAARKSDDFYSILILGMVDETANPDVILLASYDAAGQTLDVMSIPRDTLVNVPWDLKRINAVYQYYGGGQSGLEATKREAAELVGFAPDHTAVVTGAGAAGLIDAIGGVEFDVPADMDYEDPAQNLSIHLKKGLQKLDGEAAMGLLRYRHGNYKNGKVLGYANGDLDRIEVQQAFLTAALKQLCRAENAARIPALAQSIKDAVDTDLTAADLVHLGTAALSGLTAEGVRCTTMPNEPVSVYSRAVKNNQSYVVPKPEELPALVNALSPYRTELTMDDLDVMSVDESGALHSSTGRLEDAAAAGIAGGRETESIP